jgi:opacity protein-like surface antigen
MRNFNREKVEMTRFAVAMIILIAMICSFAVAQDLTPKVQVFGGYSLVHAGTGGLTGPAVDSALGVPSGTFGVASNFNGWNAEAQYDVTRWVGIVADFGGRYGTPITASSASGVSGLPNLSAYSFLFGPVLSYKTKARMTPFVHALFGWDRASLSASALSGVPFSSSSAATTYTDFAMALGGGLDYKLSRHLAVRVGQLDYLYTGHDLNSLYGSAFGPGRFQGLASQENNLRFSAGIVLRF